MMYAKYNQNTFLTDSDLSHDNLQVDRILQCVSAMALLIKEMCRER